MKKFMTMAMAAAMVASVGTTAMAAEPKTADLSNAKVAVNGEAIAPQAYTIDGYTYFKLRDVAKALAGTVAGFDVSWDQEARMVALQTGAVYKAQDGETDAAAFAKKAEAHLSADPVMVNGAEAALEAYNIDGYNYFKLRDLGNLLGFTVGWDTATSSISITTPWGGNTAQQPNQNIVSVPVEKEETDEEKAERFIEEVIELTNEEREKEGLPALGTMTKLDKAAQIRADELKEKYSHDRPDGSRCFTVLDDVNINGYSAVGENIALGQRSPEQVVQAWMNSEGHRRNIMNVQFEKIGVGYADNNGWVQLFYAD